MATTYTLSKYKDVYTLKNIDPLLQPFRYTLSKIDCFTSTIVKDATLQPGLEVDLFSGVIDGNYELVVYSDNSLTKIDYYYNLIKDIIENTEKVVCGCKECNDCEDCTDCNLYLTTINTALAYYFLNVPLYNEKLESVALSMDCDTSEKVSCYIAKQMITGESDVNQLVLRMIGFYYLAFYYTDLSLAIDTAEEVYINEKYKSSKILKCLKNMGMIITSPVAPTPLVYFWQLTNVLDDITDIIPIFTLAYLNDKPSELLTVFEQGKIVNYTGTARVAFAIRKVEISDFVITDALNNDVTDDFDKYYFSDTKTWLFVSKLVYANSSIYFKFKQLP